MLPDPEKTTNISKTSANYLQPDVAYQQNISKNLWHQRFISVLSAHRKSSRGSCLQKRSKETDLKKFTVAGIVRARFEQIEKLMYEGMTQTAIVESLNEELKDAGFATTVENFRNELHRARKKREAMGLGKFNPGESLKSQTKISPPKDNNKPEPKATTVDQAAKGGPLSLPAKPETKVYGGTPKGNDADDLF